MGSPVRKGLLSFGFLAIFSIIAGCADTHGIGPQAHRIDPSSLDPGASLRAADADAQWPAADWWRSYGDPQLNAWVEAAQTGNPSLAAAQARVREAVSMAGISRAALSPQVNGNLSVQREHWPDDLYYGPGPLASQNTWNNTGTLSLSWHPDLWGRDRNTAERALDAAHARAADARAAQLELETNVVRTYVQIAMNYALLDIAHATLEHQQKILSLANRRLKGGLGTQLEVSQAETPLPESERQIEMLQEAIALGSNQLAALAGKGPGAGAPISRPTLALSTPVNLPSALPADLIGHRPDIVAARWSVAGEARGIEVAKAGFYPDIDLLASIGGFATAGPMFQLLHAANGGWTGGPALSLPIFDGGRLRAQLGAASAGYDQAVERYNQSIVGALQDVADQVVRMRSLAAQQADAERSVAMADKNYRLSAEGYRRGLTDYLNVLAAQTQLLQAQESVARIQAGRLGAHASLMAALGGGLATPEDGPTDAAMAAPGRSGPPAGVVAVARTGNPASPPGHASAAVADTASTAAR